jgi:hypothetical protein
MFFHFSNLPLPRFLFSYAVIYVRQIEIFYESFVNEILNDKLSYADKRQPMCMATAREHQVFTHNDILSFSKNEAKSIPICHGDKYPCNKLGTKLASLSLTLIRFAHPHL